MMLFIPQIANKIYNILDTTMLGVLIIDKSEVGFYEISQKIMRVLLTIVTSLGTVMLPRIASMYAKNKKELINEYMEKSFNLTYLLCFPLIFGIIAISQNFVPWFLGDGYNKVIILINILSPIVLFMGIANIFGSQYLLATKRQKEYTVSILIGIVLNFYLNYIMIKLWESIGACIATIISECAVVIIQAYFVRKNVNLKAIIKIAYKYLFSALIMFVICLAVKLFCNGFLCIVIQIILGIFIYFFCLVTQKDELLFWVMHKLNEIKKQK